MRWILLFLDTYPCKTYQTTIILESWWIAVIGDSCTKEYIIILKAHIVPWDCEKSSITQIEKLNNNCVNCVSYLWAPSLFWFLILCMLSMCLLTFFFMHVCYLSLILIHLTFIDDCIAYRFENFRYHHSTLDVKLLN